MPRRILLHILALFLASSVARAGFPTFAISFDSQTRVEPATGRLILFMIGPDAKGLEKKEPADGPFYGTPQPLYGTDVKELVPDQVAIIDDSATCYPAKLSELKPGQYRAQVIFRIHHEHSGWRRDPGNLYSDPITFTISDEVSATPQRIILNHVVAPRVVLATQGVELFSTPSKLLSDFRGRPTQLNAGVVFPIDYDPHRSYPAVYSVPGFSGDHFGAFANLESRKKLDKQSALYELYRNVFWISVDPESSNGHTLLANSQVNGPCGDAFVQELIPALEAKYHLIASPSARLLKGHSSGGYSVLWLALHYPQIFDNCWCISPDPVSFHRLERIDIYKQEDAYQDCDSTPDHPIPAPSQRNATTRQTARDENLIEEVLGPDNTSGDQWDSWFAVFGPRNSADHPTALFDPQTGKIDRTISEQYKSHDINELLSQNPSTYGPILAKNVRLIVGAKDTYFLNEAVAILKTTFDNLKIEGPSAERHGYIKIVPNADHGSILRTLEGMSMPTEMLDHLQRHAHIPSTQP